MQGDLESCMYACVQQVNHVSQDFILLACYIQCEKLVKVTMCTTVTLLQKQMSTKQPIFSSLSCRFGTQ